VLAFETPMLQATLDNDADKSSQLIFNRPLKGQYALKPL
jgi:hypothetical protein